MMITFLKILAISYIGMLVNSFVSAIITKELHNYFYGVLLISINRFWFMLLSVAAAHYIVSFFVGNEKIMHILFMYILCVLFLLLLSLTHSQPFSKEWLYPNGLWYLGYATVTFLIYIVALKYKMI